MSGRTLLVMARHPLPGRTKTRLAAEVGDVAAATAQARMLDELLATVRRWRQADDRVVVVVDPPECVDEFAQRFAGDLPCRAQRPGDLGRRLTVAVIDGFGAGAERVVVVGSDCVEVTVELLDRAFDALTDHDVAVGPALDGGYWLIAMARPLPELFRDVPWSTDRVLETTLGHAARLDLSVARLPTLRDVDTLADVRALGREDLLDGAPA